MDITKGGLAGFRAHLGNIHNTKKFSSQYNQAVLVEDKYIIDSGGVKTELPDEIDRIHVSVAQDVDFCYYVYYFCYINS